jgi:BirA family transcriptional regulator, biotin operon repressor / biotin---[acetyl-CoA-carboxylase] ligase
MVRTVRFGNIGTLTNNTKSRAVQIEYVESVDSTNAELLRRSFAGSPAGVLIASPPQALLAGLQTAGRGRSDRVWHGWPDVTMMLSVAIERYCAGQFVPGLSLSLGVACAEVLEAIGAPAIGLKWPNDLQIGGDKLGGMLIQARTLESVERTVVGVGINLRLPPGLQQLVSQPVTALDQHLTNPPSAQQLAGRLAPALVDACQQHWRDGFAPFRARWQARDVLAGEPISVLDSDARSRDAVAIGVDQDGFLLARHQQRTERIISADVSIRKR